MTAPASDISGGMSRSALGLPRRGRAEIALLLAALLVLAVGGLSMRLGPRWPRRLFFRGPAGIVIHHTATGAAVEGHRVDADRIARWHERRGFSAEYRGEVYHIGYHYVILPDGALQRGRPEWMLGADEGTFDLEWARLTCRKFLASLFPGEFS